MIKKKYYLIKNKNGKYGILQLMIPTKVGWFSKLPQPRRQFLDVSEITSERDFRNYEIYSWWYDDLKYDRVWADTKEDALSRWEEYKKLRKEIYGQEEYELLEELNIDD